MQSGDWSGIAISRAHLPVFLLLFFLLASPVLAGGPAGAGTPQGPVLRENNSPTEIPSPSPLIDVTYPVIADDHRRGTINRTYTFVFEQENLTLDTSASAAAYHGAQKGDKYAVAPQGTPYQLIVPGYYHAFMYDPHQEQLFLDLIAGFRSIRSSHNLTDDEYLELVTAFVQEIPYDVEAGSRPDNPPRFPVETIVDGTGDCDDKSLLLAGLLSREGYDVVLFLFVPEHHVAVGVRNSSAQYLDTGYLYIEATKPSFVGEVPTTLSISPKHNPTEEEQAAGMPLNSTPQVIHAGSGTRQFMSADQVAYILAAKARADTNATVFRQQMNCTVQGPSCNQTLVAEYNRFAAVHNAVVQNRTDRAGTYRYLVSLEAKPVQKATPVPATTAPPWPWSWFAGNVSAPWCVIPGLCR